LGPYNVDPQGQCLYAEEAPAKSVPFLNASGQTHDCVSEITISQVQSLRFDDKVTLYVDTVYPDERQGSIASLHPANEKSSSFDSPEQTTKIHLGSRVRFPKCYGTYFPKST